LVVVSAKHILKGAAIYVSVEADTAYVRAAATSPKLRKLQPRNGVSYELIGSRIRCLVPLVQNGQSLVCAHPDTALDVAAFRIQLGNFISCGGESLRVLNLKCVDSGALLPRMDIHLGKLVYFVGFPMRVGADEGFPISPVVRSGTVAWIDPKGKEFYIDGTSMGGNSGGPVFSAGGLTANGERGFEMAVPRLCGVIFGHRGTVSGPQQVEIENWDLARTVWSDDIVLVAAMAAGLGEVRR